MSSSMERTLLPSHSGGPWCRPGMGHASFEDKTLRRFRADEIRTQPPLQSPFDADFVGEAHAARKAVSLPAPLGKASAAGKTLLSRALALGENMDASLNTLAPYRSRKFKTARSCMNVPVESQNTDMVIEGFFAIGTDSRGMPEAEVCWPQRLRNSRLEAALIDDGFCPDTQAYGSPEPHGFGKSAFVFSLLETALDADGDPNGILFGCVCGSAEHDADSQDVVFQSKEDQPAADKAMTSSEQRSIETSCQVLCLVSKVPMFELLFSILDIIRRCMSCAEHLLGRVNELSNLFDLLISSNRLDADLASALCTLQLRVPQLALSWRGDLADGCRAFHYAQWQASWGLRMMLTHWEDIVGDTLIKLLIAVLLEQKVILVGKVSQSSACAITLHALLAPFRWLHPFLSAPAPPKLLAMPLLEATMPLILVLRGLPQEWEYSTIYELPVDVIAGLLQHNFVHVSPSFTTVSGLHAAGLKFPDGRHLALVKHISAAKQKARTDEWSLQQAVEAIHQAFQREVQHIHSVFQEYVGHEVKKELIALGGTNSNRSDTHLLHLRSLCMEKVSDRQVFLSWLNGSLIDSGRSQDALLFYDSFFQTQMCQDILHSEIVKQTTE